MALTAPLLLRDKQILPGEQWIYSAGFNLSPSLVDTTRIDIEIDDITWLAGKGARVAILSHHGSWGKKSALHLDFVARYIEGKLGKQVSYFPENTTQEALKRKEKMTTGEVVIFGNTRFHKGEEEGNPELARQLSRLGDFAAIGGFSKAHRNHASNTGLLDVLPGFATQSLQDEIRMISAISSPPKDHLCLAFIGGTKREKILQGYDWFRHHCDVIVPGGILLNSLLQIRDIPIGGSFLGDAQEQTMGFLHSIRGEKCRAQVTLPDKLHVASKDDDGKFGPIRTLSLGEHIKESEEIVDFEFKLPEELNRRLHNGQPAQIIIAGPPARIKEGFDRALGCMLEILRSFDTKVIILGGDSGQEIPYAGTRSSGGGAALHILQTNTCAVWDALSRNRQIFNSKK